MKYALIIGNNKYDDPKLAQLKTPAADSQALAKVLDDKSIGSFDEVTPLINQSESKVRRAISSFLTNKKPDDLVLLYFSGHGVLDDRGRLYLALKDTQFDLLKATSIPSSFVADEMDSCRSRRQILVLDCCHSGAFERGTKGEQKAITETTFEGSGFGRVVLTASDSTQYALEGDQVIKQTELSLFTHFLLEGLKTGEADMNNDGHIALDEWYDYTYAKVVAETPRQVPHKWSYNQQGDLIIARNPFLKKRVVELPYELVQALESPFVGIRESAVIEVAKYLKSRDSEMVDLATAALENMKNDDSRRISLLAEKMLAEAGHARLQTSEVISSKTTVPETAKVSKDELIESPKMVAETEAPSMVGKRISQQHTAQENIPVDHSVPIQKSVFNPSFWFKWIGMTVLGIIFSSMVIDFEASLHQEGYVYLSYFFVIVFGAVAGGLSFIQWFFFRDRLADWWIAVNAAVGVIFGLLHRSFLVSRGWDRLSILLAIWLIGNFVLGLNFIGKTQGKPRNFWSLFPTKRATKLEESVTGQKSERLLFDRLFWAKWIGIIILAILSLARLFYYHTTSNDSMQTLILLFGFLAGLTGLAQWFFFRDRLKFWWVPVNAVTGLGLGAFHEGLHNNSDWGTEDVLVLMVTWVIVNFVLGLVLMRSTQEKSEELSPIIDTGARHNLFLMLLSVSLILGAISNLVVVLEKWDYLGIAWILYSISAILVSLSFLLKKQVPRNFGFIALALFSLFDGINVARLAFGIDTRYYFSVNGILALAAGIFFLSHRQTWKNFGFIMGSGNLILTGLAGFAVYDTTVSALLLFLSVLFAIPAAIYFLLRK